MTENPLVRRLAAIGLVSMLMVVSLLMVFSPLKEDLPEGDLPAFESEAQLRKFLSDHRSRGWDNIGIGDEAGGGESHHSGTNVQVAGVDEIDVVKNNGKYLFISSGDEVAVIEASPEGELLVESTIAATELTDGDDDQAWVVGLFLQDDILAVIISEHQWSTFPTIDMLPGPENDRSMTTCVLLDISDASDPQVIYRCSMSGWFTAGRSMGGHIYLLSQENIWGAGEIQLPVTGAEGDPEEVKATEIRFDPQATEQGAFLNIMALDMVNKMVNFTTLVMGYSSVLYVSLQNMYLTNEVYPSYEGGASDWGAPSTNIVRLRLNGTSVVPEAKCQVSGFLHNQFSMDEHEGLLRVATCTGWNEGENQVHLLDEELNTVGKLEGIAPGETIQSARFMGDTLYLVTFLNTDPLFVIDLSVHTSPRLLGELMVPGFSSYLHPIGGGMLAGIGLDNWTFKISLYDVNDPASPREIGTLMAPAFSWSEANWDHKAVQFDTRRSWLFVPYNSYDQRTGFLEQVVWAVCLGEGGLTTLAELDIGNWSTYVRCILIEDTLIVITESQASSYDLDGFTAVGYVAYGGDWIIRGETSNVGQGPGG
jgi:uncharacterized secreted protein with C-terminal beta-propeller domain